MTLPLLWGCLGLVIWSCLPQAHQLSHETTTPMRSKQFAHGEGSLAHGSDNLCKLQPKLRYIFLDVLCNLKDFLKTLQVYCRVCSIPATCRLWSNRIMQSGEKLLLECCIHSISHRGRRPVKFCSDPPHASLPLSYHRCWGNWWLFPLKRLLQQGGILTGILFRLPLAVSEQHSKEGAIPLCFTVFSTSTWRQLNQKSFTYIHLIWVIGLRMNVNYKNAANLYQNRWK